MLSRCVKATMSFIIFTLKTVTALMIVFLIFIIFTVIQNKSITVTKYTIKNEKIPTSFHGFKICQLSDVHNDFSGKRLDKLIKKTKAANPDIIVLTGDLVDSERYNPQNTLEVLSKLKEIAPVYYVFGNHDFVVNGDSFYERIIDDIEDMGVQVLNIKSSKITRGEDSIEILGIQDPSTLHFIERYSSMRSYGEKIDTMLDDVLESVDKNSFKLLLSHRPEYFDNYVEKNIDLAVTGHAHGGQFRIPLIGGIYAPGQGFFPKYTSGVHQKDNTQMIVSRGLGNSRFPVRVFNVPEIVEITLE